MNKGLDPDIKFEEFEFGNDGFDIDGFLFDTSGFEVSNDFFIDTQPTRYLKPTIHKKLKEQFLKYRYAEKLVEDIGLIKKDERYHVIVNGSFIYGDFISAYLYKNNIICKEITISTLSLSEHNINTLADIIENGWTEKLNLIVSHYWYSLYKKDLSQKIYDWCDIEDKFQFAVCSSHCKTILMETTDGDYIVVHGSANLRSSQNLENMCIENNKELYDFFFEYQNIMLERYKTINKAIRAVQMNKLIGM